MSVIEIQEYTLITRDWLKKEGSSVSETVIFPKVRVQTVYYSLAPPTEDNKKVHGGDTKNAPLVTCRDMSMPCECWFHMQTKEVQKKGGEIL